MKRGSIFYSTNYPTFMYVALVVTSLLIIFNSISLFEQKEFKKILTASAVKEIEEEKKTQEIKEQEKVPPQKFKEEQLYSAKTYFFYYLIITVFIFCIIFLSFRYLFPYLRDYS